MRFLRFRFLRFRFLRFRFPRFRFLRFRFPRFRFLRFQGDSDFSRFGSKTLAASRRYVSSVAPYVSGAVRFGRRGIYVSGVGPAYVSAPRAFCACGAGFLGLPDGRFARRGAWAGAPGRPGAFLLNDPAF